MGEEGCCIPTISTLTVDVVTNTRSLSKGLKLAGTAVLAVGAIATKMALDYNDAFTKIAAVSNASAAQIENWKGAVLELAGKTAQAPKELADALFFLASAGLKANQIMPVLEASAKASAAGLGETADIAKLTANVLNAYAGSGLKAAKVTDILVAAVREGSADTDEFGTAIGRILPIASAAGIGFDSVAASLASLSNVGLDVNEGVTAMRGLFQALVSPTDSAATAMKSVGLSAQDLLDSLQQDGLIATIRLLDSAVKQNTGTQAEYMGTLRDIVPNVRSLTGLLGLTSQEAERVNGVFQRVNESTGSLNEAFATTAESAGFKFRQALAELSVVAIQLGDLILPVLAGIIQFLMEEVPPAWDAMVEGLTKAWHAVQPFAQAIGSVLIPLLEKTWHTIQDRILPVLDRIKPLLIVIGAAVVLFATMIVAQFALVVTAVGFVIDKFLDLVGFVRDKVVEPIVNFLARIGDALGKVAGWIRDRFVDAWQAASGPVLAVIHGFSSAIETLIGWIKDAINWLGQLGKGVADALAEKGAAAGVFSGVSPPPGPEHGGFVTRTGLATIHKGEMFSGVHNEMGFGGGGGDIVLQIDGQTFARITRDQLVKLGKRNVTTGIS